MTIHITPEPQFSYVSFESNIPASSYLSIVTNILNTFNPGKFILTIFATKVKTKNMIISIGFSVQKFFQTSVAAPSHQELKVCGRFGDWIRNDIQYCSFQVCLRTNFSTKWIDKIPIILYVLFYT